jgi:class 3 adenylate cyclase
MVGSTALASRLDPEDLREVLGAYHAAVAEAVVQFGGYMGDGVLAYFGYLQAHENDAERAVRAGLALMECIGRLESRGGKLASRVGIATGLVIVGDLIGSGDAQERGVVGETPNLAARLQQMAPPNAVLVAEATRRLVGETVSILSVHWPGSSCRARALEIDLPGSIGKWIKVPSAEFLGL